MNIISDRGSNFVAAFRPFEPLFCFGHRLNNVLKTTFFQNKMKKKVADSKLTTVDRIIVNSPIQEEKKFSPVIDSDFSSSGESEQESYSLPAMSVKKKQTKQSRKETNSEKEQSLRRIHVDDISIEAKKVILTLSQCKKIVRYIKKVSNTYLLFLFSFDV